MLTTYKRILKQPGGVVAALCAALLFGALGVSSVQAQIPPNNDNLAQAIGINGVSGMITGTNLNATAETNELPPLTNNPAQASIWYLWTAPISSEMDFSTTNSTDPNTGDPMDTVMAVYQLTSGTNLSYTNLTQITNNDDSPSGGVGSRVDFYATVGTVYLIQVDGAVDPNTGTNAQGIVVLNWLPAQVGGNFGFTASDYFAGEMDDIIPVDFPGNPVAPSLAHDSGTPNVRITVARKGGSDGRCIVAVTLTNWLYTNTFITNYTGTNIYINDGIGDYTNILSTNISSQNIFESVINQQETATIHQYPVETLINVTITNTSISQPTGIVTNLTLTGLDLNNFIPRTTYDTKTTNFSTNGLIVVTTITELFSTNFMTNEVVSSASNGIDYTGFTTNLIFNDFQMSKDFYVQVNPAGGGGIGSLAGPDWVPVQNYYGINPRVEMMITNVMMDTNESLDIVPATIDMTRSNSFLNILTFSLNAANFLKNGNLSTNISRGPGGSGVVLMNLERATFRTAKANQNVEMYIVLNGNPQQGDSYHGHYTIDCSGIDYPGYIGTPGSAFNWDGFRTVASSDYATPAYYGANFPDFGNPIDTPYDPTPADAGRYTRFPAEANWFGSFTFGPFPNNPTLAEIAVPTFNQGGVSFDNDALIELFVTAADFQANTNSKTPGYLGNVIEAPLTINFSGTEPGGANDTSFNLEGSSSSYPPNNPVPGANGGDVKAVAVQANGQSIIGGYFTSYNSTPEYGVARLLANGFLDTSFNNVAVPGVNYGGMVDAIAIDSSNRIVIAGSFQSYDGTNAVNIARLNPDGSLDTSFISGIGFNGIVYSLAIDPSNNIIVGGDFTSYNTTNVNHVARLLPSGGLDPAFLPNTANGNPNIGTDEAVRSVALDTLGNVVVGGDFTQVNGSNYVYVARLLPTGGLDTSFNPEIGPDDSVYSVAVRPTDNEVLIGGAFQNFNLVSRPGVALLQVNGALDTGFAPGTGSDGIIYSVLFQTNNDVLAGGQFRAFNGTRRLSVVRLLPSGWVDTSFMDTSYDQFAGLINTYRNDPINIAYALALQPDGNIMMGGSFVRVGGGGTRDAIHAKINVARLIGQPTPGPQTGGGGIGNCPGNITFTQNPYTVDDTAGKLFVTLDRVNGSLGAAQITVDTNMLPPGSGAAGVKDFGLILPAQPTYSAVDKYWSISPAGSYGFRDSDGFYGFNNAVQPVGDFGDSSMNLSIYNNKTALQNLFAGLSLLDPTALDLLSLGGVSIPMYPALGVPSASLDIINDNFPPGILGFSATNFVAVNTSKSVTISVLRTNGNFGQVTVEYYTANGTAISGANFTGAQAGPKTVLTFPGGAVSNIATFSIPLIAQSTVQSNKYFKLYLTAPSYTGAFDTNVPPLLPSNSIVTIIDGSFAPGHLEFTSPTYSVIKGGTATVSVERLGGAQGQLTVQVGTSNGTAINGLNYTGLTNTLSWGDQDASVKTFSFPTLHDNTVDGSKLVNVSLFNATNIGNNASNSYILNAQSTAQVTIIDSDSYGLFSFAAPNFNVLQNAGQALITVLRTNGTTGTVTLNFATSDGTNLLLPYMPAQAGTNYGATNGTLVFGPGVTSQSFLVPIYYTPGETNAAHRVLNLTLFNATPSGVTNEFPISATLTILDNQLVLNPAGAIDKTTLNGTGFNGPVSSMSLQPDGSILAGGVFTFFNQYPFNYVARLTPSASFDSTFLFNQPGADAPVYQVVSQLPPPSQTNGPILVAGDFSQIDSANRRHIARMNIDGSVDETFNPGSGADGTVYTAVATALPPPISGQPATVAYYVGGAFANYGGVASAGVARINASTNSPGLQGMVDLNFNVGQGVTGSNAAIRALGVQANNQVLAGGDFTSFDGLPHQHLVRLNVDGSLDSSFNPTFSGSVRAIAVQADGQILVGGLFTNVNGSNMNYLARLNQDGTLDTNFNVGVGGNDAVMAIVLDSQQRILVGGQFTRFSGVTRSGITRLNSDGTVDPTINFGSGADGGYVDAILVQTNDEIDLAGGFSTFQGVSENNFVRVYGGANFGDGAIQFSQSTYGVSQDGTNAYITLVRTGGEGTAQQPTVTVVFSTSDGTGVAGTDYVGVTNTLTFPLGETFEKVTVPIINGSVVANDKTVNLNLANPTYAVLGPVASAKLIITNVNSAVEFASPIFNQSAAAPGGNAIIPIVRVGNPNTIVSVTVYTGTNGTATPYTNYIPQSNNMVFNPGVMTNYFLVPVLNATNMFADQTVDLEMNSPSNAFLGAPSTATLTIDSVFNGPGVLSFSMTNYTVSEGATNAAITVLRTNGSMGAVAVMLSTSNGTAISGLNYSNTSVTVNFAATEVSKTVLIPIYQQAFAGPDTTLYLTLSNPQPLPSQGGPAIGSGQATLTIRNNIASFSFTNAPYVVNEAAGAVTIQVARSGPLTNASSVSYTTYTPPNSSESNGYAVPNVDYVPVSGTLNFVSNETFATFPVPILQTNAVNGPLSFQVLLNNPTPAGTQIGVPGTTTVTILSDITGFKFDTNSYTVGEDGTNLMVNVIRVNPNTGNVSVQFATANGSATNQIDYVPTNGTLYFADGQASNSIALQIINRNIVENNKTFGISLFNPQVLSATNALTNAYLLAPSNTTVTITNVLTGLSFQSPSFISSECGVTASIPVILTGITNHSVTVTCSTTNGGSAQAGINYFPVSSTLTFNPGQTVQTMNVQLIDDHVITADHTVFLTMYNALGAQIISPSTAVLDIQECDGAYIIKSGTAFISGNMTPSGVILPNETVTLALGLRDVSDVGTTNLVATLLATNGITNIAVPTKTYGVLLTNGPTVSQQYTFQVTGTNGQTVNAVLALHDGSTVYSNVVFGLTVGGTTTTFSNNEVLLLYGSNNPPSKAYSTNAPNYGYPSVINVSGVAGNVTAVTATLNNFGHTYPADVAAVLQSPLNQSTYLMSGAGGTVGVQHINLTFSQSAATMLPQSTALMTGTYLPTAYTSALLPPVTGTQKMGPFPTTLTNFQSQSPNGTWSLFVADEDQLDSGYISNGWSLTISTGIPVEQDSDLQLTMITTPLAATVSNTLTYTINVTNYGPANATNVVISDVLPVGATYLTNGCNCTVTTNGALTYSMGNLPVGSGATFTIGVIPSALGYLTNIASVTANQVNPNSNNVQTSVVLVSPDSADVGVTLTGTPNPLVNGSSVNYFIVVTNNGPSSSAGIVAVDVLPAGFTASSLTPTQGAVTNVNGNITWTVGTLGSVSNSFATLTIVAGANLASNSLPTTSLDSVTVTAGTYDPAKLNNYAAVKTQVEPSMLSSIPSVSGAMLTWPARDANTFLQGSVSLPPTWVTITNPTVTYQVVNGRTNCCYTLPGTNGYHFFRLMSQLP